MSRSKSLLTLMFLSVVIVFYFTIFFQNFKITLYPARRVLEHHTERRFKSEDASKL